MGSILWTIGRDPEHVSCFLADRFSRYNRQAKYRTAGWRALGLFYSYHAIVKHQLKNHLEGWVIRYRIGKMENRQAVTNRLKVTIALPSSAYSEFAGDPSPGNSFSTRD